MSSSSDRFRIDERKIFFEDPWEDIPAVDFNELNFKFFHCNLTCKMDEQLDFRVPIRPEDLLTIDGFYAVENQISVDNLSEKQVQKLLEGI
jgi:hypothetical protein